MAKYLQVSFRDVYDDDRYSLVFTSEEIVEDVCK